MRSVISILIVACLGLACGCTPPASEGGFDSPDPAAKLYAITRAGQQKDHSTIPQLIEQLDSDDIAVRMFAIGSLERITGTRLGYVYYDPPAKRYEAIGRWLKEYKNGRFNVKPQTKQTTAKQS